MSLPKQVQEQLEEADRLEQAVVAATTPQEPAPEPQPPEQVEGQPADPAPTPELEPAPEAPKPHEEETWERRYKTLDGKYKAEVPRLAHEVRELKDQLQQALAKIQAAASEPKPAQPKKQLVTEKDVEAFGSDLIDLVKRQATEVASDTVSEEVERLRQENERLISQLDSVSGRQGESDRRVYFSELGQIVPDYEAINVDDGFIAWLAEVDPLSGAPRQSYLNEAFRTFDAHRTAVLFNAYKEQLAPQTQTRKPISKELERQVAPSASRAASPAPTAANSKIWSTKEITKFYSDVAQGSYRGRDAEQAKTESEIDLAVAEGRVTG